MQRNFILCLFFGVLLLTGCEQPGEARAPISDDPYANLKNTLCDRQIVLLGEGSSHDEGATTALKSRIAKDLIEECGFSLMVFESSFYQFVNLNRDLSAGKQIPQEQIEAGIGWLWRNQVDFEPLLKTLHAKTNDGGVTIAGMDDQISGRGQDYANYDLPIELTEGLQLERQTKCREAINWRVTSAFTKGNPYNLEKKRFILSCLEAAVDSEDAQMAAMRASLIRDFQRDHLGDEAQFTSRDRSMYENFEYWYERQENPKTIIWTASVHATKKAFDDGPNTGELIHSRFGDDAYTLGISALSGIRGRPGRPPKTLPEAPDNAIEALVFKDVAFKEIEDEFVFLNTKALADFGTAPAAVFGDRFYARDWSNLLDGLVVLRTQRPQALMPISTE